MFWFIVCSLGRLIVGTFTDFEHLIIPDEITFGGMGAGLLCAALAPRSHWDALHRHPLNGRLEAVWNSVLGMAVGAGLIYAVVRGGKGFPRPLPD